MKARALTMTFALLMMLFLPIVLAGHQNGNPECDPANFDTSPRFTDGCYHQGVWYSPDATEFDVLIFPPQSANELRDWQLIEQSLDNWELGIKALGADWLNEGLSINDYTVGKEFVPPEALSDPEVVVVLHSGVVPLGGYAGLATYFAGFCHGQGLSTDILGQSTWHQHPGSPFGHALAACGGGGHVCTVTNAGPLAIDNANDRRVHFDLISHEIGHCLTLGHVGDATTESLDDSDAYPEHDIMSYESDGHHASTMHCPSTLNVRTIEAAFSNLLGQGGSTRNQVQNGANAVYTHMHPDEWSTHDCVQSEATFADAEWLTTFNPAAEDTDEDPEKPGQPTVTIAAPADGATVPAGPVTVNGTVDRNGGGNGLTASISAPETAVPGEAVAIEGTATGGESAAGFTCSWSDDSGGSTYGDPSACTTTVTFDAAGDVQLTLTVDDGSSTDSATQEIAVRTGGLPTPDGSITGSFYAYNTGGVGASNVLASVVTSTAGDPVPKYVAGETVSLASRSTSGGGIAPSNDVDFSIFDDQGNLVHGPVEAPGSVDTNPVTGAETARFDPPDLTIPVDWSGRYYMAYLAHMGGTTGDVWIQDASLDDPSGLKPIDVVSPGGGSSGSSSGGAVGVSLSTEGGGASCGGFDLVALDAADDSTADPGGAQELLCLGAGVEGGRFHFGVDVADASQRQVSGPVWYDIYFTPGFGTNAGTAQMVSVQYSADGSVSAFWDVGGNDPTGFTFPSYSADPSRPDVQAGVEGNTVTVDFPVSYLGEPADGDSLADVFVDTNDCNDGSTCDLQHRDYAPDGQDGVYAFGGGGGGSGNEFFFHGDQAGVVETGDPQASATYMDRDAPTGSESKVFVKPPGLGGVFPGTVYGPSWTYDAGGLGIENVSVTITWYALVAGPTGATGSIVPTNWDLEVWVDDGSGSWTRTDTTADEQNPDLAAAVRTSIPVTAGQVTELSYTFEDVSAKVDPDGRFAVTVGQVFAVDDGAAAFFYDSAEHPAGVSIDYADEPLSAEAGGPYAGNPGQAVALSGSFSGGDGSATCAWSTSDDGEFGDPAACSTTVSFATVGAKTVTLTVTDGTGSATDNASVTISEEPPGERVEILLDGDLADSRPVDTSTSSTAGFEGSLDLTGLTGSHTITAQWLDADDTLLDSDTVEVTVGEPGEDEIEITSHQDGQEVEPGIATLTGNVSRASAGAGGNTVSNDARPLPLDIGDARPYNSHTVKEALEIWGTSQSGSPDGPFVPDHENADGVGPGSGLLIGNQLCTAAWIFEDQATGALYLSTAGHCLMKDSDQGAPIDGSSPNAADAVEICFQGCVVNWAAGLDSFLGMRADYVRLETNETYDPVAFAQAEGVGSDFGLIAIPAEAAPLLRWWLPQWGGPTGVHTGGLGLLDTAVHFGHGTYCCPLVGGVLTRTPMDQGRIAQFNFADSASFQAVAGWASGGDSGSPVGKAAAGRVGDKGVVGDTAVGVLTHGFLPVHSGFLGTMVTRGLSMAESFNPGLSGLELVTEDGPGDDPTTEEPSNDGGVVVGELGSLTVSDDGANLTLALDLEGLLDGDVPQVQASPIEVSVNMFMAHNDEGSGSGLRYQADYSFELVEQDANGPTGTFFVDEFGLTVVTDVGTDNLATLCPVGTDLSGSSYDPATKTATWVIPLTAFTHDNFPTRDQGCGAFTTTGGPLGPGDEVTDIVARAAPKAVVLSGFPAVDETEPQDYTVSGDDNTPPLADAGVDQTVVEGDQVSLAGACSDVDGNLVSCAWSQVSGPAVSITDNGDGTGSFTAPEVDASTDVVLRLTATDSEDATGTDNVTVTVEDSTGGQEHVEVWIDGAKVGDDVPVGPTDDANPTASWSTGVDLAPYAGQTITVSARWVEADGSLLATDDVTLTVGSDNDPPTAGLTADPNPVEEHADVTFALSSEDSDGTIVSWSLHFGDDSAPATGTGAPPATVTHAYGQKGDYWANLTVTDDDGATGFGGVTVTVVDGPNTGPSAHIDGPSSAKAGTEVTFDGSGSSDPDGTIVEWRWDMGDGTVLFGQTVTHSYSTPGKMDIVLTVTDDDGATGTATFRHIVQGPPA